MTTRKTGDDMTPTCQLGKEGLICAAQLGDDQGQPMSVVHDLPLASKGWQEPVEEAHLDCCITLRISFFFDGTGNNLKLDEPTLQNSNVSRLFRAHPENNPGAGIYRFYIPGVGTPFPEIGDKGGSASELAFGKGGDARLDWAMQQLENTINKHPPGKTLEEVQINAFGFSRGAAEARAFANRIQAKCQQKDGVWRWKACNLPLRFCFLGLFDTVASVGFVPTASLIDSLQMATGSGWRSSDDILEKRRTRSGAALSDLAFGQPGADPTGDGVFDGHMGWGGQMAIPALVKKCVHFVAMHEQRNSFSCESVRAGSSYPPNCEEYAYPGMHSDVGGGYEPGDQGRGLNDALKLSQIPLIHMHALALEHGVPLQGIDEISNPLHQSYFRLPAELQDRWNHYMQQAGRGGRSLGQMVNAHTRLWYQWRFQRIHAHLDAIEGRTEGDTLPNATELREQEAAFAQRRAAQQEKVNAAKQELQTARTQLHRLRMQQQSMGRLASLDSGMREKLAEALDQVKTREDAHHQASLELGNIPGDDASQYITWYDRNLLKGMKLLQQLAAQKGSANLRPHYRMLLETYEAEMRGDGLRDQAIMDFFNNHVHDSLAGFHKDVTLPSDPRLFYNGGDDMVEYANNNQPQRAMA